MKKGKRLINLQQLGRAARGTVDNPQASPNRRVRGGRVRLQAHFDRVRREHPGLQGDAPCPRGLPYGYFSDESEGNPDGPVYASNSVAKHCKRLALGTCPYSSRAKGSGS